MDHERDVAAVYIPPVLVVMTAMGACPFHHTMAVSGGCLEQKGFLFPSLWNTIDGEG